MSLGPATAQGGAGRFFDDFSDADLTGLRAAGWTPRTAAGHPGVPGAQWGESQLRLIDDPALKGNRLLRLSAETDGTGPGTRQAQLCQQRKFFEGTYAARIRFSDAPVQGVDGDPVIQTFYAVAPLRHDYDPQFSEIDWEYLPNGGWGSDRTRLYGISWQTVRIEPWDAHNGSHEEMGALGAGDAAWHVLLMQVSGGRVRLFLDGRQVAEHGGRNYPVVPMSINFNLWFSPGGLLPASAVTRRYEQDVDWVFHARNEVLGPPQVAAAVADYRRRGLAREDGVPASQPALDSRCDF
ncbi:glycoside hydrolase family 16 protein [Pelomonas sp. APW6]|uniref:Glycoside hydrolase family 16 protein n=1 Tax=Roseateles subflavus TaxID=3053353 RepID=A0ABT7LP43_9BURK|nr:glycoside hydrolase family 16 protein [Pelomonas sp. APW6]MDL5034643.1 glycoside hydrolase family 16 protein [Pelomonas sp. APW6]